jgi:peptidyl-prolyl cis-trans isomerase D
VKYIDVQVTASAEDKAAIQKEVAEYTNQLAAADVDYTSFIRTTGSTYPYVDIPYTKKALPTDIAARLDSVSMGQVYGPYYNAGDNTINSFKVLAKEAAADSVEFRQIQVLAADAAKTKVLADSIMGALKAGGDFAAIAKKYGQTGDANWMSSANYENAQVDGDNLKFLKAVTSLGVNELANLSLGQANVILQVTNKKGVR